MAQVHFISMITKILNKLYKNKEVEEESHEKKMVKLDSKFNYLPDLIFYVSVCILFNIIELQDYEIGKKYNANFILNSKKECLLYLMKSNDEEKKL